MVVYIVTLVFLSIFFLFLSLSLLFFGCVALLPDADIVHSKCGGEATPRLGTISMKIFSLIFLCVNFYNKCAILACSHILCLNVSLCTSITTSLTLIP